MDLRFQTLGRKRRERVRTIARESYIANIGISDHAKRDASKRIKAEFAASSILGAIAMKVIINIAVSLAAKMIANWAMQKLSSPPMNYTLGEPGYQK